MVSETRYLKWENEIIGVINKNNAVSFIEPGFNEVVSLYTQGRSKWSPEKFNEYRNLIGVRPQFQDNIVQMILLDFITRQDDQHLSNIAIKISAGSESFYALYDNGRSLFYEDTEEMARDAVKDPVGYATSFGYSGTYWDYVQEISSEGGRLDELINTEITEDEIRNILKEAGFTGYRFNCSLEWILKTIDMIRGLSGRKQNLSPQ